MNILHHKSWHVRTKQNIERVRRDEEKAANEEKERQRKIALAEQEARTDLLRKRAKLRDGDQLDEPSAKKPCLSDAATSSKSVDIYTNSGNINFFKDIESGEKKSGTNAENEADKKAEKEKWEKDIGLLTYLGQSAVEAQDHKPWYLNKRCEDSETDKVDSKMMKQKKEMGRMDPLEEMKGYLHGKKHKHKDKKHKDHKEKHKKNSKERETMKTSSNTSSSKSIEQLRAERLKREQGERRRTEALLLGNKGQGGTEVIEEPLDERKRGYNSVFNPDLARKPRSHHQRRAYNDY